MVPYGETGGRALRPYMQFWNTLSRNIGTNTGEIMTNEQSQSDEEIVNLNIDDLDIEQLEQRLEMAAAHMIDGLLDPCPELVVCGTFTGECPNLLNCGEFHET